MVTKIIENYENGVYNKVGIYANPNAGALFRLDITELVESQDREIQKLETQYEDDIGDLLDEIEELKGRINDLEDCEFFEESR